MELASAPAARSLSPWVEDRVNAVGSFYNSLDTKYALEFLKTYHVRYIIVGQLERAAYDPQGLSKFRRLKGNTGMPCIRRGIR